MKKRIHLIILIIPCLLFFTGCGAVLTNYREISTLQVVQTLGIDNTGDGVTISMSTGSTNRETPTILSHRGESITTAMDSLQDYSAKENLFFAHTNHIVLGEETAASGIAYILDYVTRVIQMRTVIPMYIVKNNTAKTLVTGIGDGSYDITDVLQSLERDVELRSESHVYTSGEITQSLMENGAALICAVGCADTEEVIFSGGGGFSAIPEGFAVIKGDKLIGFLSPTLSRSANLLLDNIRGGYATVKDPGGEKVTLDIKSGSTEFTAVYAEDGSMSKILVDSTLNMGVSEFKTPAHISDPEFRAYLESAKAAQVFSRINQVLEFSQEKGADFLGIGKKLRAQNPISFSKIPGGWKEAFEQVEFEVSVEVCILMSYDIVDPPLLLS